MANKNESRRKKPVSQKRVAVVLASLVFMMTMGAAMLLAMEGGSLGTSVPGWAINQPDIPAMVVPAVPLQAQAWKFIILYESQDLTASADGLADGLVQGGQSSEPSKVRPKANFHFVIDGAQSGSGTMDGALEVGTSWQNQSAGAPFALWPDNSSYSYTPYTNAVGVCLVADLNRKAPSEMQRQTLLRLVRELQKQLNIPSDRVLFPWEVPGRPNGLRPTPAQEAFAQSVKSALQ